jgi:hypothetical protein
MNSKRVQSALKRIFFGNYIKLGFKQYLRAYLVASILFTIFITLVLPGDSETTSIIGSNASVNEKSSPSKPPTKLPSEPSVDPSIVIEESKLMSNGGFSQTELKTLNLSSKLMYEYVNLYAGYVVGTSNIAAMQYGCSKLEESYPVVARVFSDSVYFDDLLDRAKDYFYEAKVTCSHAFKKNRINEIQESASYASTAKAFFDGILKEIKK